VDPSVLIQHHTNLSHSLSSKLRQNLRESVITNACVDRLQQQLQPPFHKIKTDNESNKGVWARVVDTVSQIVAPVVKVFRAFKKLF